MQRPIVLGGAGAVVQVDESLFSHKVKAHRGHPPKEQVWVFGIVDTRFQPALAHMRIVDRRDSATLLPIITSVVAPRSIVHSDEWSSYRVIRSQLGLTQSFNTVHFSIWCSHQHCGVILESSPAEGGTGEWADATPISFKMEYYII